MTPNEPGTTTPTVGDVMSKDVVVVHESDTLAEAARRLRAGAVSGAPVVDNEGRCVGVVSAVDFVERAADDCGEPRTVTEVLSRDTPDDPYRVVPVRDDTVGRHMTPYAQTVTPDTPLVAACREMVRLGVHRLIVTDRRGRPVGVVTPLDALGALVLDDPRQREP